MSSAEEALRDESPENVPGFGKASDLGALLDKCSYAYVTKHDTVVNAIRTSNLDEDPAWEVCEL